ncbi:hypothetical protein [Nocardioides mesophilus]|uniref:Uncharacterized protein n=1 Tax=Nocardioides mesophilus TaxID=433659 RepID=A0A7G9REJ7_9ACTN|nr:hypothetical protein [Nocardioides mesophilus]QNN54022.1 hypothetical protein H9L09_06485 [Nocardioides mesophilus]
MTESSGSTRTRQRSVPPWALLLVALLALALGVAIGRAPFFWPRDPEVAVGEATLANKHNWLTIVRSDDLDGVVAFDARSVAWVDDDGVYSDGFGDQEPPCLRVNRPARVEISYLDLDSGAVVTQVRCLPAA